MNEAEWVTCTDPAEMLREIRGRVSLRKLRLFACACCRRVWHLLIDPRSRHGLEVCELHTEGKASDEALRQALDAARAAAWDGRLAEALTGKKRNHSQKLAAEAVAHLGAQHYRNEEELRSKVARAVPDGVRERAWQCDALRCVASHVFHEAAVDPSWLGWNDGLVVGLAGKIHEEQAFELLPILGDALEDAGCTDAALLGHLHSPGPHLCGCWALDLLLGKE
jgi:hypothetical protein